MAKEGNTYEITPQMFLLRRGTSLGEGTKPLQRKSARFLPLTQLCEELQVTESSHANSLVQGHPQTKASLFPAIPFPSYCRLGSSIASSLSWVPRAFSSLGATPSSRQDCRNGDHPLLHFSLPPAKEQGPALCCIWSTLFSSFFGPLGTSIYLLCAVSFSSSSCPPSGVTPKHYISNST